MNILVGNMLELTQMNLCLNNGVGKWRSLAFFLHTRTYYCSISCLSNQLTCPVNYVGALGFTTEHVCPSEWTCPLFFWMHPLKSVDASTEVAGLIQSACAFIKNLDCLVQLLL